MVESIHLKIVSLKTLLTVNYCWCCCSWCCCCSLLILFISLAIKWDDLCVSSACAVKLAVNASCWSCVWNHYIYSWIEQLQKKTLSIFCCLFYSFSFAHFVSLSFPSVCIYFNMKWFDSISIRIVWVDWRAAHPVHQFVWSISEYWIYTLFAWIVIALCNSMMIMASIEFPLKIWNWTEWTRLHVKIGAYVSHIRLPMKIVARVSNELERTEHQHQ